MLGSDLVCLEKLVVVFNTRPSDIELQSIYRNIYLDIKAYGNVQPMLQALAPTRLIDIRHFRRVPYDD